MFRPCHRIRTSMLLAQASSGARRRTSTISPFLSGETCRSPIIHPRKLLCCSTFIAVMKTAELWNCDNLSHLQHLSGERTLLVEAQVGSRFVVVAEVRRQRPLEMASVQDDVVVQTFPSNRADESLVYGFCHGLCGAVRISCMPSDWIRSRTSALYLLSRSRMR